MNSRVFLAVLAVLSGHCGHAGELPYRSSVAADFDGDGSMEIVEVDSRREPALSVGHGRNVIWRGMPRRWKPWKLTTGVLEPAGARRIIVATFKSTRYIPQPHNCLFVYGWKANQAYPVWLGSSLDHPFTEFAFARVWSTPCDQLVTVETLLDGRHCIAVYSWGTFGFNLDWQSSQSWKTASLLSARPGAVTIKADGKLLILNPPTALASALESRSHRAPKGTAVN